MFTELINMFNSLSTNSGKIADKFTVNLNNRQIKSISSFSANSIFYFPLIVSDQCQLDEVTMIARALEKQYASFVIACISQVPFQRVSSHNAWAVDEYLKQFHQNLGIAPGADTVSHAYSRISSYASKISEDASAAVPPPMVGVEDFFLKVWNESVEKEQDYVSYLAENYISLNDVFNESATDPYTQALVNTYKVVNEELDTWGFVGPEPPQGLVNYGLRESADDDFGYEPQYEPLEDGDAVDSDPVPVDEGANPVDKVKYTLDSITDNKIRSCKNKTKLRSMEAKLNGLKKKYTTYLKRYKKRYEENEKNGTSKKLVIRFNKESIGDPKAFMAEYGSYMKVINYKLNLCKERREELTVRAGGGKNVTANESVMFDLTRSEYAMDEAALRAKDRNVIPDDQFGIPSKRKFPLNDEKHVKLAIQMSGHANGEAERKELAANIARRAAALDMSISVSKKNALYKYLPKSMQESTEIDPFNDLTDLDEQAMDSLLEMADYQLRANDDEVFVLIEGPDYEDYFEMNKERDQYKKERDHYKKAFEGLRDAELRRREQMKREAEANKDADKTAKVDPKKGSTSTTTTSTNRRYFGISNKNPGDSELRMDRRNPELKDMEVHTFDREIFTKMDMQKANEMIPTFAKAQIGFIVDETEQVVFRDILIGIKTYVHRVQTGTLVNEIYQGIMSKRKFLKFVKFVSGEERSLADLLFGIKELRMDARNTLKSSTRWNAAFKERKRLSKMSIPFVMKNYLPNGTIVMTMNEVEYIKSTYGIDIMRGDHAAMLMDVNFLLGFVVMDQTNEIVHVMYHGVNMGQFQQYSYAALDREQKNTDREMRELFRLMNR